MTVSDATTDFDLTALANPLKDTTVEGTGAKQITASGETATLTANDTSTLHIQFSDDVSGKQINAGPVELGKVTIKETDEKKEKKVTIKIANIDVPANGKFLIQFTD